MKTQIGITDENRAAVAEILSKLLADEFVPTSSFSPKTNGFVL